MADRSAERYERELTHERLASRFDELMDDHDLGRRASTLIDHFLGNTLRGRRVLDAGCGVGGLTRALVDRGAHVVAFDIGPQLAATTRARCRCHAVVGTLTGLGIRTGVFDVVLSSEAIEHTPDPIAALLELYRVVRPGGHLVVSTPNRLWQAPVRIASAFGMRPYDGFENFLWPYQLRRTLQQAGAEVLEQRGIHLWPFQLKFLRKASTWVDQFGGTLLPLMINQCLHCVKPVRS